MKFTQTGDRNTVSKTLHIWYSLQNNRLYKCNMDIRNDIHAIDTIINLQQLQCTAYRETNNVTVCKNSLKKYTIKIRIKDVKKNNDCIHEYEKNCVAV